MTGTRETAAQLDTAIDTILQGETAPRPLGESELVATARLLRESLPRLHPRFTFEDLLASRLAAARRAEMSTTAPTPLRPSLAAGAAGDGVDTDREAADRRRRGLVAGGAIASGVSLALPLAGAALVVWRRTRSSGGIL